MELIYAGVLWGAIGLGLACILMCARGEKIEPASEQPAPKMPEA